MRQRRRQLSASAQQRAADALAHHLCQLAVFRYAKRIAFYLANDGEINPEIAMSVAQAAGKYCFLPVLHPSRQKSQRRLFFLRHEAHDPLVSNRYGILEPSLQWRQPTPLRCLDVILLPLVAFDSHGNRLGMGGGFYDRTLQRRSKQTQLIGLAHSCQAVDNIPARAWDIPLHSIVTDSGIITPSTTQPKNTDTAQ